jgi:hypothetical protein
LKSEIANPLSFKLILDFNILDENAQLPVNLVDEQYYDLLLGKYGAGTSALLQESLGDSSFI